MLRRALLVLVLAGCSAPRDPGPTPAAPPEPVAVEAAGPEWARIAEEAARGRTVAEQQRLAESERRYQLALAWFNRGDFDKAKVEAQAAVQAWPEHLAAWKLLDDVNEIIVGGSTRVAGVGDPELRVARVTVEQARLEIENHLLHGKRFLDAGMYAAALREFENAEFKIRNMAYDVRSMNDLLPGLQALKARARSSLKE
jgi:tetratricopeptide (TPR) repeat protein